MGERESIEEVNFLAACIDSSIRILYNSDKNIFNEIFGNEDGPYLWSKFVNDFNANEGSFICYLDNKNQLLFARSVVEYAKKNDVRLK